MGRKSTVKTSPYEAEIVELLQSGWSAHRVRMYLLDRFPDDQANVPSTRAIERYRRQHLPSAPLLPPSPIDQALNGLRYRVDTLAVLDNVIWALRDRVARWWQQERETGKRDRHLDGAMQSLLQYMRERHRIAMELGVDRVAARTAAHAQGRAPELPEEDFQEILEIMRLREERLRTVPDPTLE